MVQIEPGPISDGENGEEDLFLDEPHLRRLQSCAKDKTRMQHLTALVELGVAVITMERDVWNLWCAEMYSGMMRIRIYATYSKMQTPRKPTRAPKAPTPAAKHWQAVLPHVCIDPTEWFALSRESDSISLSSHMFWVPGLVRVWPANPVAMAIGRTISRTTESTSFPHPSR